MSVYLKVKSKKIKKNMMNRWYKMMEPLANYLTKKEKEKYKKEVEKITLVKAVNYIKKDIINYMVRSNNTVYFVVADWINTEDTPEYFCLGAYPRRILKSGKAKKGFNKYKWTIENQVLVVEALRETKGITIKEEVEKFTYQQPKNYQKTYIITLT
jgi:hypothetical protein